MLPKAFCESGHVDPHIERRYLLQSNYAAGYQIPRCPVVPCESFEIGGGELDEGLEEVPLFSVVANCMPKSFKDFVALPPVGVVVEVYPIQIFL
jgi:hypothetical protein